MLDSLSLLQLLLAVVILSAAYFIRGIAGFGSGLIAIPLLAMMLPLTLVVPVVGLLDYLASASHGTSHRHAIAWRELLPLLPFSLCGVVLALYLFKTVDALLLRKTLGGFVAGYGLYSLLYAGPTRPGSRWWAIPVGGFGGLIGTLFGTGGPFYVIYLKLRGLDMTAFRATVAAI
ncbi:MAG TPA: sulfite exporter TauE/SafE family protein, partial [Gammaproteobacteria bacterium]